MQACIQSSILSILYSVHTLLFYFLVCLFLSWLLFYFSFVIPFLAYCVLFLLLKSKQKSKNNLLSDGSRIFHVRVLKVNWKGICVAYFHEVIKLSLIRCCPCRQKNCRLVARPRAQTCGYQANSHMQPMELHGSLLIYRPRKDGRLSGPGWLTYSRHFTHEVATCQA